MTDGRQLMKYTTIAALLLTLLSMPTPSFADNPPEGMSHLPEASFTYIYSDNKGRSIAIIPAIKTTEISQACEAHKPLWIYGVPTAGKCLALMPPRFTPDDGLVELQVTFAPRNYKEIVLLSTRDINKEKQSFRGLSDDELASLTSEFPSLLKKEFINKIKASDYGNADKLFFVPIEKINEPTDDPYDPPCTRLKTLVLQKNKNGLSKTGFLDNMPQYLVNIQAGAAPMAITYTYCNTGASLWKIYPKVEEEADFSNGIGG
jgi:hypothetical protein